MSKTTHPKNELITVQVTLAQLRLLNEFNHRDANDFARFLRSVCIAAVESDIVHYGNLAMVLGWAELIQDLATEHFENHSFTHSTHNP